MTMRSESDRPPTTTHEPLSDQLAWGESVAVELPDGRLVEATVEEIDDRYDELVLDLHR